jgi:hypothetical protein
MAFRVLFDGRRGRDLKHSLDIHHSNLGKSILAQMRYVDQYLSRAWRSPRTVTVARHLDDCSHSFVARKRDPKVHHVRTPQKKQSWQIYRTLIAYSITKQQSILPTSNTSGG